MKGLREKLLRHEGFTLVEMLIVVAIIAILVAVSIPLVNTSLEKARHAVDDANMRSAVMLGDVKCLTESTDVTGKYYYKVDTSKQGSLIEEAQKANATEAQCACNSGHKGQIIEVNIAADGKVSATWVNKS